MKTKSPTHSSSIFQNTFQNSVQSTQKAPSAASTKMKQKVDAADLSAQKEKQLDQLLGKERQTGKLPDLTQTPDSNKTLKWIPGTTQPLLNGRAVSGTSTPPKTSKSITVAYEAMQLGCEVEKYKLGPYTVNIIKVGNERFPKGLVKKALDAINRCPTRFQRIQQQSKGNDQIDVFLGDVDTFAEMFKGHSLIGEFATQLENTRLYFKRDEKHPGNGQYHGKALISGAYTNKVHFSVSDAYNGIFIDPSNELYSANGRVQLDEPEWKQVHDLALLLSHEMTHATTNNGHSDRSYPGVEKELSAVRKRLDDVSSSTLLKFVDAYKSPLMADGSPFQTFLRDGWKALNATDPARAKDEYIRAWNWIMSGSNIDSPTIESVRESGSTLTKYVNATYIPGLYDFLNGEQE